jgi:hypothetical protein
MDNAEHHALCSGASPKAISVFSIERAKKDCKYPRSYHCGRRAGKSFAQEGAIIS